jgi:hypothetical protein
MRQFDMPERPHGSGAVERRGLALLRRIMTTEGVQGYAKGQAMQYIVQDKGKDEIPFLKKLLTDLTERPKTASDSHDGAPRPPASARQASLVSLVAAK